MPEILKKHDEDVAARLVSLAVDKDASNKGIGTKMTRLAYGLMKEKGFNLAYAECSSEYARRALVNSGGVVKSTIEYDEYAVSGGVFNCCSKPTTPLKDMPSPHTAMNLVVVNLDEIEVDMGNPA